jgi:hypothetical protein
MRDGPSETYWQTRRQLTAELAQEVASSVRNAKRLRRNLEVLVEMHTSLVQVARSCAMLAHPPVAADTLSTTDTESLPHARQKTSRGH